VVATATGAYGVLSAKHLQAMKDGAFILNVGHVSQEIDVPFLKQHARHSLPMPYVDAYEFDGLNAFDVTLAVMASGIGHIVGAGAEHAAGLYLLPESAWMPVL
jgi:adenosylhomocysteinase